MKVWISSEMESDVAEMFRVARNAVEDDLSDFLANKNYDLELDSLDCIAIVRNDSDFKEIQRYSPTKRDMDFRLVIDYHEFKGSSFEHQKSLIIKMLIRAVTILSEKKTVKKKAAFELLHDLNDFMAAECPN